MNRGLLVRLLICVFAALGCLYTYIDKLNALTELKIALPALSEELRVLQEKNAQMLLIIERFENPSRLIALLREKEFSHLRYPYAHEVVVIHGKD